MSPAEGEPRRGGVEHAPQQESWTVGRREPPLTELLDDPMIRLIWARDRIEPERGRAIVRSLQATLRRRCAGSQIKSA